MTKHANKVLKIKISLSMLLWLDYKKLQSANTKTKIQSKIWLKYCITPRYLWHFTLFYVPQLIKKAEFRLKGITLVLKDYPVLCHINKEDTVLRRFPDCGMTAVQQAYIFKDVSMFGYLKKRKSSNK